MDGVRPGQGLLRNNKAIGRVIEASEHFALALPLINQEVEWSVRIGASGPVARLVWEGGDVRRAVLYDVPRSAVFTAGDSVISSGFQGYFPPGLMVGRVADEETDFDGQFSAFLQLAADFRSIRYVELASLQGRDEIRSLGNVNTPTQP